MSFLESGKARSRWAEARHSPRRHPGCAQCGRRLEMNAAGLYDPSGKCLNCANPVHDGDDGFDELPD